MISNNIELFLIFNRFFNHGAGFKFIRGWCMLLWHGIANCLIDVFLLNSSTEFAVTSSKIQCILSRKVILTVFRWLKPNQLSFPGLSLPLR